MVTDRTPVLLYDTNPVPPVGPGTTLGATVTEAPIALDVSTLNEALRLAVRLRWCLENGYWKLALSQVEQLRQSLTDALTKTPAASLVTKSVAKGTIGFTLPLTEIDRDA